MSSLEQCLETSDKCQIGFEEHFMLLVVWVSFYMHFQEHFSFLYFILSLHEIRFVVNYSDLCNAPPSYTLFILWKTQAYYVRLPVYVQ